MTGVLAPVVFDAPLVNPAPNGLFAATTWQTDDGPLRWLAAGVDVRVFNYGGGDAFGVWAADWDAAESDLAPEDVKVGDRPEFPDTFTAMTTWAYDEGALAEWSQAEVQARAAQTHRLQEPNAVEGAVATRLLADAGTPDAGDDIVHALGLLEGRLAETNTVGVIHASAHVASMAAKNNLIVRSGAALKTPLGHTWIFGGGYVDGLDYTLVATSPPFGWRGPVAVRDSFRLPHNRYSAIAERSLVIGWEAVIGAATID